MTKTNNKPLVSLTSTNPFSKGPLNKYGVIMEERFNRHSDAGDARRSTLSYSNDTVTYLCNNVMYGDSI